MLWFSTTQCKSGDSWLGQWKGIPPSSKSNTTVDGSEIRRWELKVVSFSGYLQGFFVHPRFLPSTVPFPRPPWLHIGKIHLLATTLGIAQILARDLALQLPKIPESSVPNPWKLSHLQYVGVSENYGYPQIIHFNVNMTLIKGIAIKKFSGAPNTTKSIRPKSPSIVWQGCQ